MLTDGLFMLSSRDLCASDDQNTDDDLSSVCYQTSTAVVGAAVPHARIFENFLQHHVMIVVCTCILPRSQAPARCSLQAAMSVSCTYRGAHLSCTQKICASFSAFASSNLCAQAGRVRGRVMSTLTHAHARTHIHQQYFLVVYFESK